MREEDDDVEVIYDLTPAEEKQAIDYIVQQFHAGDEFVRLFVLEEWRSRHRKRHRDEATQVYLGRRRLRRGHGVRDEGHPARIHPKP